MQSADISSILISEVIFIIRLKELRTSKKLNQETLAKDLGVSQSTLSYWERGDYQPDNENLIIIANYFEVSVDYLLGRSDIPNPELIIPDSMKDSLFAFNGGDTSDLTQKEVDKIEEYIQFVKSQRKD